ncbi:hypothetical protein EON81_06190 [bacterium]|nr:MAG: hypothetical protein EON81_06190 [bacterium]
MEVRDDVLSPEARPATTFGWKGAFGLAVWALAILFAAWTGGGTFDWTEKSSIGMTSMDTVAINAK